jgi:transposase-like protein
MTDTNKVCDLCGLTLEVTGFTLTTKEGHKSFCCEGCKSIFQLLNEDQLIPAASEQESDLNSEPKS